MLIIDRPEDPLSYLISYLGKEIKECPSIVIFGPTASGKHSVGKMLEQRFNCITITEEEVYGLSSEGKKATPKQLAVALKKRLKEIDCEKRGYVLIGYPTNERQAKALLWEGIFPEHAVFLDAPMQALIERENGNRVDPITGERYHLISKPPPDVQTEKRLVLSPESAPEQVQMRIEAYNRDVVLLDRIYTRVARHINANQPLTDVYAAVLSFVTQPHRSLALRTPRVLLLGYVGSGRKTQAELLSKKYGLILINCSLLIKQEIAKCSLLGKAMKSYSTRKLPVPDAIVAEAVKSRLTQSDCSMRGWVLLGYPRTKQQAELLDSDGLSPNRVFSLDIPQVCAAERLTGRRVDPVTGQQFHTASKPSELDSPARMLQNPQDRECVIGSKLAQYAAHREELLDHYGNMVIHVHADLDYHTVFEEIEAGLVNPLPVDYHGRQEA
ncbi:unnamed protein product [Dicrocoelium dendriticum]|nr:unnamed protein product [Dicrocoelium dendriticum]